MFHLRGKPFVSIRSHFLDTAEILLLENHSVGQDAVVLQIVVSVDTTEHVSTEHLRTARL